MLSVASTRTGPKSSAIITAPGEKCGLGNTVQPETRQALADVASLHDRARSHLAGSDVDEVQIELYDLALSWAEIRAAKVAVD